MLFRSEMARAYHRIDLENRAAGLLEVSLALRRGLHPPRERLHINRIAKHVMAPIDWASTAVAPRSSRTMLRVSAAQTERS